MANRRDTKPLALRDAAVALRSLPRRFGELVRGPKDDDVWDRLVRTVGPGQTRSALGWVGLVATSTAVLADAVRALPTHATPALSLQSVERDDHEPMPTESVEHVLARLQIAAISAAEAIEARRPADTDRPIRVDGTDVAFGDVLSTVVHGAVGHLRDVSAALDAARFAR